MIGIIYKFTIIAKYKMDGHHPFYIGQHWCKSKEDFLERNYLILIAEKNIGIMGIDIAMR